MHVLQLLLNKKSIYISVQNQKIIVTDRVKWNILSVYLAVCLSACLTACLSVCLSYLFWQQMGSISWCRWRISNRIRKAFPRIIADGLSNKRMMRWIKSYNKNNNELLTYTAMKMSLIIIKFGPHVRNKMLYIF